MAHTLLKQGDDDVGCRITGWQKRPLRRPKAAKLENNERRMGGNPPVHEEFRRRRGDLGCFGA
jgi:hypothetical protein